MCGIAGILNVAETRPIEERSIRQMLAMIRHRGPDQFGIYLDRWAGLGNARLSIIDLSSGQQPISNEDGTLWIVFNGEIFNYLELSEELRARGHRFATKGDTEVVVHAFEEYGPDCVHRFNGQFAFAIWDTRNRTLFMARDRLGVRPLFYAQAGGVLIFGSEIKAVLADRRVRAEIDPVALDQIFTFWSVLSPRTPFRNIAEVPPGHYLLARNGAIEVESYWQVGFLREEERAARKRSESDYLEEFRELLIDAVKIRLRADVPVGAYLSGGIDSSTIAAIVRNYTASRLDTFSIAFRDPQFDESEYQRRMAEFLGTEHQVVFITPADIGGCFPEVIWHTETPVLRTAPAPMFLLSRLVRDRHFKVVLTGEGADEFLAGYDLFKEAKVRRFCARQPHSKWRPLLFKRLYPDIAKLSTNTSSFLSAFFSDSADNADAPDFSHAIRWRNSGRTRRFFADDVARAAAKGYPGARNAIRYPAEFMSWGPLERGQYLESTILLSQYLLSSQGDRMAMAHSVEGRFPFLDHRVVEFCNRLPANLKLRGLTEKYLLKKVGQEWLPREIWQRPKRPYRAPIHRSFFNNTTPDYVHDLLSPESLRAAGFFKPQAVGQLVRKIQQGVPVGETDDMALAGIISTQLVHRQFVTHYTMPAPLSERDDVKVCRGENL